jgi:putative hydrolase of the HAD superfamily
MIKICNERLFQSLPDCILFDIDNTFYAYEPAHKEALKVLKSNISDTLNVKIKDVDINFEKARNDIKKQLKNTASSHNRLLYIQRMFEHFGLGSQILLSLNLEQIYWSTFLCHAQLFENLEDFLEEVRLLKIPLVIVTDLTAQIQFRKMVYFDLDHYFDYIITSEEVGFDKPNPRSFLFALEKMQINKTGNIWFIGDNPIKDIEGAKRTLRATTLQKIHAGILPAKGKYRADLQFSHYKELIKLLKKIKK